MKIISEIKVKVNGELCMAKVTDDGYAIMPDGTQKKLSEQQFATILEKIEKMPSVNEAARPLTLPEIAPVVENVGKDIDIQCISKVENIETSDNQGIQTEAKPQKAYTKPKSTKKIKPIREKKPWLFTNILMVIIGLLLAINIFLFVTSEKTLFLNNSPNPEVVIPPEATPEPDTKKDTPLKSATEEELDEAKTILIVARIVTPEGEEKEVVIGYFTTDDDNSALPNVVGDTDSSTNLVDSVNTGNSQPKKKASVKDDSSGMISLKSINY